ncbi:unnamed protein product [Paramecium pentaurelia]|uniref:Inhibitor of apoptosis-promoting Bax1 protein n=1 Tax=Paramecium pentaurelia TaxID=43138 RepID=A0A8S1SFJ0_9CILI|nr:unnamed protein product [Paramecium pentaurelia]
MKLDEEQQPILYSSDNYQEPSEIDSSLEARLGFIKKVYTIINIQILFTGTLTLLQINYQDKQEINSSQIWLFVIALIIAIVLIFCLLCNKIYARKSPKNLFLLIIFSLNSGYVISQICCFVALKYEIANNLIQIAIYIIFIMITGLTMLAWQTKENVTFCKSILISLALFLVLLPTFYYIYQIQLVEIIYLALAIFLYLLYIIYDIYKIFDAKRHSLQKNDYILGALFLYVDMIYVFSDILKYLTNYGE